MKLSHANPRTQRAFRPARPGLANHRKRLWIDSHAGVRSSLAPWASLLLGVVLCSCQSTSAETVSVDPPPTATVPLVSARAGDEILSFDAVSDRRQNLHLVWVVAVKSEVGALPEETTFYGRGEDGGSRWTGLTRIGHSLQSPRLEWVGSSLYLVTGPPLRLFRSSDGASWTGPLEIPKLGPAGAQIGFDLAANQVEAALACLVRPAPPYSTGERGPDHRRRLRWVRLDEMGGTQVGEIATFPPSLSTQPAPRLIWQGRTLHLLAGLNEEVWDDSASASTPTLSFRGRVVYFRSEDGGRSWSEPFPVTAPGQAWDTIGDLDLVASPQGLQAFFSAGGLYVSRSGDGVVWEDPLELSGAVEKAVGGGDPRLLGAALGEGGGKAAWIDTRNRKTDSRWWNPLGGFPWSDDDPRWLNNDVFMADFAPLDASLTGLTEPTRVTPDGGYARCVRVCRLGNRLVLLWAGRTRVGRRLDEFGQPPRLFYRVF